MSKKQLLTESEVRRFMRLANIPALGKGLVSEMKDEREMAREANQAPPMGAPSGSPQEEAMDPMAAEAAPAADMGAADDVMGGMEGGETVEVGGDVDPEKKSAFEAAVQALADAMGIDVELESQEESGEEGGEEMHDLGDEGGEEEGEEEGGEEDEGDKEEMQEAAEEEDEGMMKEEKHEDEEEDKEEKEEKKDESKKLSEDELVEAVLSRVTARLVAEAKKKKMTVKQKMKAKAEKKKEEKKEKMDEATDSKGGGPLLSKGGNKHDTYKGHADMQYAKGKEGKGGHAMETVTAKAEHTVTHGKTNLATKGGNKTK